MCVAIRGVDVTRESVRWGLLWDMSVLSEVIGPLGAEGHGLWTCLSLTSKKILCMHGAHLCLTCVAWMLMRITHAYNFFCDPTYYCCFGDFPLFFTVFFGLYTIYLSTEERRGVWLISHHVFGHRSRSYSYLFACCTSELKVMLCVVWLLFNSHYI
jgi:hypothetical protein